MSVRADKPAASAGRRRVVATYSSGAEAERAVGWLKQNGVAAEGVAIVNSGLRHSAPAKTTVADRAAVGAGQGGLIGLLTGLIFPVFFDGPGLVGLVVFMVIAGAALGALSGAIFGALGLGALRRRGGSTSNAPATVQRHEVQVDEASADEARRLLDAMPSTTT